MARKVPLYRTAYVSQKEKRQSTAEDRDNSVALIVGIMAE